MVTVLVDASKAVHEYHRGVEFEPKGPIEGIVAPLARSPWSEPEFQLADQGVVHAEDSFWAQVVCSLDSQAEEQIPIADFMAHQGPDMVEQSFALQEAKSRLTEEEHQRGRSEITAQLRVDQVPSKSREVKHEMEPQLEGMVFEKLYGDEIDRYRREKQRFGDLC